MTRRGLPVGPPPASSWISRSTRRSRSRRFSGRAGGSGCVRGGGAAWPASCSWPRSARSGSSRWRERGPPGSGSSRASGCAWGARGARQPLPLRGRGARAHRARGGREHPRPRHRGAQGAPARLALGGRRHRARARCPTPCGSRSASGCRSRWPSSTGLYLMDEDGGLIDIYGPRTGAFDLPIVRGLLGVEEESRRDRARRAGALLADLAELGSEISEVYVEPSGDLRVVLRGPGEVLLLRRPALPPAARHVPEPAPGARARRRPAPSTSTCVSAAASSRGARGPSHPRPSRGPIPPSRRRRNRTPGPPARVDPHRPAPVRTAAGRAAPHPPAREAARVTAGASRPPRGPRGRSLGAPREEALAKKKDRYIVGLDVGHPQDLRHRGRDHRRGPPRRDRHRPDRVQGPAQGRRHQPRGHRRRHQARARGGGADGGGRDRLGLRRHRRHPHQGLQLARRDRGLRARTA